MVQPAVLSAVHGSREESGRSERASERARKQESEPGGYSVDRPDGRHPRRSGRTAPRLLRSMHTISTRPACGAHRTGRASAWGWGAWLPRECERTGDVQRTAVVADLVHHLNAACNACSIWARHAPARDRRGSAAGKSLGDRACSSDSRMQLSPIMVR